MSNVSSSISSSSRPKKTGAASRAKPKNRGPKPVPPVAEQLVTNSWNPRWALLLVFVVFYGAQYFSAFLISLYQALGHRFTSQTTFLPRDAVTTQFAYILLTEAFVVGAIYLFLRGYKLNLASIGLHKPRWRDPAYALAVLPVYFVLYLVSVSLAIHFFPSLDVNQEQQIGFDQVKGVVQLVQTFIALVILIPLTEEIMVRGLLYSSLKKLMPLAGAVLTTSLLFASAHLPEGGSAGPLYIAAIDTFVLSLVLIYLREKTGSLWASITLHATKNSIAFFILFIAPLLHVTWLN